jgi:hypothetical protein
MLMHNPSGIPILVTSMYSKDIAGHQRGIDVYHRRTGRYFILEPSSFESLIIGSDVG